MDLRAIHHKVKNGISVNEHKDWNQPLLHHALPQLIFIAIWEIFYDQLKEEENPSNEQTGTMYHLIYFG